MSRWMTLKYNLSNGCFVYLSCWGVHRASYCNCMETDRSLSERSQFIFSFLLCIIHYLRAVLIQGRYSEIGSCLGVVPNWTAEQLQTITPANHELVIIQKLRCKVGSSFESQLIKWDFAFMLYILSMWTCRNGGENDFSLLRRLAGSGMQSTVSLNPKMYLTRMVRGDSNAKLAAQLCLTNQHSEKIRRT